MTPTTSSPAPTVMATLGRVTRADGSASIRAELLEGRFGPFVLLGDFRRDGSAHYRVHLRPHELRRVAEMLVRGADILDRLPRGRHVDRDR